MALYRSPDYNYFQNQGDIISVLTGPISDLGFVFTRLPLETSGNERLTWAHNSGLTISIQLKIKLILDSMAMNSLTKSE